MAKYPKEEKDRLIEEFKKVLAQQI